MTKKKWLLMGIGALLVVCVLFGIMMGDSDSEGTKAEEVLDEEVVDGADLAETDMSVCIVEIFEDANSENAIMGIDFLGESARDFCDTSWLNSLNEESGFFNYYTNRKYMILLSRHLPQR